MNHLNYFRILKNTCLLSLATTATILSLSLRIPPVLAANQEPITHPLSNENDQVERVQIKRVIYFHLLNGVKKVEQMSYAHREVLSDPNKKAIWIIDPFEEVTIPEQVGFKPSIEKLPPVAETEDLSQLKSTIDVYYQPLGKDGDNKKASGENNAASLTEARKENQVKNIKINTENSEEDNERKSLDNYQMEKEQGDGTQADEDYGEINNTGKAQKLHQRITDINNRINSHRKLRKNNKVDQRTLPQTGNETDNLTTFIGLGITLMVAGMSLFSLKNTC